LLNKKLTNNKKKLFIKGENFMKNYQITPERKAHLYAMMAWSDQYSKEQAEKVFSSSDKLKEIVDMINFYAVKAEENNLW
jgi:hypothetical protein